MHLTATTIKGTLNVDEAVTLDSTLDVTGDTSVSTLDSSGATSLAASSGAVNIASSGALTTVKGTMNVDEAVTLDSTLDVSGDTSVSTLDSSGATSLATNSGAVNIASSGATTTVKGLMNVDEAVTLDSTLGVTGDVTVGSDKVTIASSTGNTVVAGTMDITGKTTITGDLETTSNLVVGGTISLNGDLNVLGSTTTIETTNVVVNDNIMGLNNGTVANQNDSGILIERGSTGDNAFMGWDESTDKFIMGTTTDTASSTGDLTITLNITS